MNNLLQKLSEKIRNAYESSVTIDEAEKLAAEFLHAQIEISNALQSVDLDSRMRKSGLKAIKAAVYLEHATKSEKKPTESMLDALVTRDELVQTEQNSFDESESNRLALENQLAIVREAHIFFRGVSRGRFE